MVALAGKNPSTLNALRSSSGKMCSSCCGVAGVPCAHCDITTPETVFVRITGATDSIEGVCFCSGIFGGGLDPVKVEGIAADDVLNDVVVELTQTGFDECIWQGYIVLDSATLTRYSDLGSCPTPDCSSVSQTRKMCLLEFELTREATQLSLRIFLTGEDTPGDYPTSCSAQWFLKTTAIACDGDDCICCELDGGASGGLYDFSSAIISTWSALCGSMHVGSLDVSAEVDGCGGDEEVASVTVEVHDPDHNAVEDASVEITLSGAIEDVVYALTGAGGYATYTSACVCVNGTINVEVTGVTKGGVVWDEDGNDVGLTDSFVMDCV